MPPRRTLIFIFILSVLAVLLGWNYVVRSGQPEIAEQAPVTPAPQPTPTQGSIAFTPEQAIAEVLAVPYTVSNVPTNPSNASPSAELEWIANRQPGMVTLFGSRISTSSATRSITQLRAQYVKPRSVLIAVDHEGGTVQRLSGQGFTRLPSWQSLCSQRESSAANATNSAELSSSDLLSQSAQELKKVGIDLVLAPVVDVGTAQAVLRTRICSEDPETVIAQATNFVTAFTAQNIIPTLKHFPGIGTTTRDLHFAFDRVTVSATEAIVYRQLLNQFPQIGVLISHVGVSNQFPDIPCSLSTDCIGELKKNYSQVLVISDALEMESASFEPVTTDNAVNPKQTLSTVAIKAMLAGNDVLLFGESVKPKEMETIYQDLLNEYQVNAAFRERVNQSVVKMQTVKQQRSGT